MKKLLVTMLAVNLCISAVQAAEFHKVEGADDLEKVKRATFRETYVNTATDFSKYNKLYLGDAYFDYRDVGPAQRHRSAGFSSSRKGVFGISEADRQKFERYADEAFMKEISKGKHFKIVDEIDEQTIIMRGAVVDIISRVPPEFVGRSEVYLSSVGEATLILEFLDAKTGEVLARIGERRAFGGGPGSGDIMTAMPTNTATVWMEVRRWASDAARRLRAELDLALEG